MAEYTEQDAERASTIVAGLLREELRGERRPDGLADGFSIVDVEANAEEFLYDLELLRWIGEDFPAMEVAGGPPSPVSLTWFLNLPWPPPGRTGLGWLDLYGPALHDVFRRIERPLRDLPRLSREEARANFSSRARDFLAIRPPGRAAL
jgi:hypothetical protein